MSLHILTFCLLILVTTATAQINVLINVDHQEVCTPAIIQFSDSSVSSLSPIIQWEWSINGAVFSTLQNPAYLVNVSGNYDICLKVWDGLNNTDSICLTNYITGYESPTADFSPDNLGGCAPQSVAFTDLSTLGDAPIDSWRWDFGDGNIDSLQQQPSHLYNTVGNFDVTLVVTDSNHCDASLLISNLITISPQVSASISPTFAYLQCALPAQVNFSGNSNTPTGLFTWSFNDGTSATGASILKNFLNPGCYSPTLTVSNGYCSASATLASCITVSVPPVAQFSVSDSTNCSLPFNPNINNSSSGMTSLNWNFGDGSVSNIYQPNYSYTSYQTEDSINYNDGVFPIILTVSNNEGCTAADTQLIYVSNLSTFLTSPTNICAPDTLNLSVSAYNISPSFYPVAWTWAANGLASTNNNLATVIYPDSGLYSSTVITTDNIGCMDTSNRTMLIGIPPVIDSIYSDTNFVCRITGIQFGALGSSYTDEWIWNFEDTSSFIGQIGNHIFQDTGYISGILLAGFRGCYTATSLDSFYIYPPIAHFDPLISCDSLMVEFIDASIGAHHWYWDFGDSSSLTDTSTLQNPSYNYPDTGVYIAMLIVYNDSTNCTDTLRKLVILEKPYSYFELPDSVCTPANLFTQNQSIDGVAWFWSAPNADSVTALNFDTKLYYEQAGIYTVRLFTYDINGCIDTFQRNLSVAGIDKNIQHLPQPACRPTTVVFTDSSTGILSPIISWLWGNGSTQTTSSESYIFPGPQEMPLSLTNDWGCHFDLIDTINIGGLFINFSAPTEICLGSSMAAVAILNAPANTYAYEPYTLIWDFGDGQKDTTTNTTITHLYNQVGVFDICLEVIDSLGCSSVFCRPNWVEVHDPSPLFTADTFYSSCPPLAVSFSHLAAPGSVWNWSFGDGSVSNLPNPIHLYSTPGFYDVILELVAFPGCSSIDTIEQMIQISGPSGFFYMPPVESCAPYSSQLIGFGNNVASYTWLFDNGDFVIHTSSLSSDTANYTYTTAGTYSPSLVINDGMGCEINYQQDSIVILPTPQAEFTADSLACLNDSIAFQLNDSSQYSYNWFFENGQPSSSSLANPVIYFADTGNLDIRLVVIDGPCVDSMIANDYLYIPANPIAKFGLSSNFCIPFDLTLSDSSSTLDGYIDSWQWNFGNGQLANNVQDTTIGYTQADSFLIQLVVANNFGCRDSSAQLMVAVQHQGAAIIADSVVCRGDSVQLMASGGTIYQWLVGSNLSDSSIANPYAILDSSSNFMVAVTDSNNCVDTASIDVKLFATLSDSLPNFSICLGDSIYLPPVNGNTIVWSGSNLSCDSCPSPLAYPYDSSSYFVVYYDSNNCLALDSLAIRVFDLNQFEALGSDSICLGDSLQLSVSGHAGLPVEWSPNYAINSTLLNNPIVFPSTDTRYLVQVEIGSCNRQDSILVNLRPPPSIQVQNSTYCAGDSATLEAFGSQIGYHWFPPDFLSNDSIQSPLTTAPFSLQYTVWGGNICGLDSSVTTVTVSPPPVVQLDSLIIAIIGDEIALANNLSNNYNYLWSPADELSCSDCPNPLWWVQGNQTFHLSVTDAAGCFSSDSIRVLTSLDCSAKSIFVPSAFSPNEDGHNDFLQLQSSSIQSIELFQIYNRWGQLVFETNDIHQAWNGRFRQQPLAPDVFGYYVLFSCPGNNKKIVKKGNITILR